MSGGHFDYDQYKIGYIADSIEAIIEKNGKKKSHEELKEESWRDADWYDKYPEDQYHDKYSDETIEKFKEGVDLLRKAQIYAHRIDWLLSGDDSEKSFFSRLEENLNTYETTLKKD